MAENRQLGNSRLNWVLNWVITFAEATALWAGKDLDESQEAVRHVRPR